MPQLDPSPWFAILVFSWLTFLTIIPQKVIKHAFHNDPAPQAAKKPATKAWDWPWH